MSTKPTAQELCYDSTRRIAIRACERLAQLGWIKPGEVSMVAEGIHTPLRSQLLIETMRAAELASQRQEPPEADRIEEWSNDLAAGTYSSNELDEIVSFLRAYATSLRRKA